MFNSFFMLTIKNQIFWILTHQWLDASPHKGLVNRCQMFCTFRTPPGNLISSNRHPFPPLFPLGDCLVSCCDILVDRSPNHLLQCGRLPYSWLSTNHRVGRPGHAPSVRIRWYWQVLRQSIANWIGVTQRNGSIVFEKVCDNICMNMKHKSVTEINGNILFKSGR